VAEENEAQEPKKKGGKLKWIIILVVLLGVLGGGGYFAYTKFFAADPDPEQPASAEGETTTAPEETTAELQGYEDLVTLPTFVVNLADPLGRRYLKLTMDVEVADAESAKKLADQEPKVRDAIILLLSSKTYQDLSTIEDKIVLKKEIVERLNQILGNGKVLRVYFTDMVIQ
jgi:flagellar FliL protein